MMRFHRHRPAPRRSRSLVAAWALALATAASIVSAQPTPRVEKAPEPTAQPTTRTNAEIRAPQSPAASLSTSRTQTASTEKEPTDLQQVERDVSPDEPPTEAGVERPEAGREGAEIRDFVVIINARNPTKQLSRKSIAKIFRKQIKKWKGWDRAA